MPQPGLMMNRPLLISGILEHGAAQFGDQEVVSRETHGPLHRSTYADVARRARQLANALQQMGLRPAARSARSPGTTTATSRPITRSRATAWSCTPATRACTRNN